MKTEIIREEKPYALHLSQSNNTYLISMETNDEEYRTIQKKNFNVHLSGENKELFENKKFEVLELTNKIFNPFVENLFTFIVKQNKSLSSSVKEIESFFESDEILTLEFARGLFAEMFVLANNKNVRPNHSNAIYDFTRDSIDLEIKSCSATSPNIKISKQQATNSEKAILMCVVVIETSEGISLQELLKSNQSLEGRYSWIANSKSRFAKTKFKVSETWEKEMYEIFKELSLPELVDDVTFVLNAKRLK